MFKKKIKRSIQVKFLGVIFGILVIASIASSIVIAQSERAMLKQSLADKGQGLAAYMAKLSTDPLIMNDTVLLDEIVSEVLNDEEIVYATIITPEGNLLTSLFSSLNYRLPEVESVTAGLPEDADLPATIAAVKKEGFIVELSVPVSTVDGDAAIGSVLVGMSKKKIDRQIVKTIGFVAMVNLATAFVLGIVLFGATKQIILSPIGKLIGTSKEVASGDLSQTVEIKANDEFGELGGATNKMVADLKKLITNIRQTSAQTASSAEQIAASSRQVKQGAMTTSQAAEETLSSMEEMAASIQSVGKNAEALSTNVQETSGSVTQMMSSVENVAKNMDSLASSVSETSSTVEQMTVTTDQVAKNMETLASTVTETSSTVEEMTVSIEQVAKNAEGLSSVVLNAAGKVEEMAQSVEEMGKHIQEAGTISRQSVEEAKEGGQALSQAFAGMKNISATMGSTAGLIQNLGKSSQEIGKIVEVIEEIAEIGRAHV